jgi:4-carboxymuconolactone decarboxylase
MTPFPVLSRDELDSEQRTLWDELTLGPRGFYTGGADAKRLPDLYNAWLQFPEFGILMLRLADAIRARTELSGRYRELIVLTTSIFLGARVEYEFHVPFAVNEGVPQAAIAAIGSGTTPEFSEEGDRIIYTANLQLLRTAVLTEDIRAGVVALVGFRGLMQLIATVTLYVVTAYTTTVARVQLAGDFAADPDQLQRFFSGQGADR